MSLLLAIGGNKNSPSIRRIQTNNATSKRIQAIFGEQEALFREGNEQSFDVNWVTDEATEISTIDVPDNMAALIDEIHDTPHTTFDILDWSRSRDVRGLAIVPDAGDERVLIQAMTRSQHLDRPRSIPLVYDGDTFKRLRTPGFQLDTKLVCIVEDGLVKFRSLYRLSIVFDTSDIYYEVTDEGLREFADKYSDIFNIDVDYFVDNANRSARRFVSLIEKNNMIEGHTVDQILNAAQATNLLLETGQDGRIFMPESNREIQEVLEFLNDNRFIGANSGETFVTNSRRGVRQNR